MRIKEARKSKHMTQKELAEKIGVDPAMISRYENGTSTPPLSKLESIANVLDVSVEYLVSSKKTDRDALDALEYVKQFYYLFIGNGGFDKELSFNYDYNPVIENETADRLRHIMDKMTYNHLKSYSNGYCELCGQKAPFLDKEGNPYLEQHQIQWFSDGGLPVPENTVFLCPNCHKRIHILADPKDIAKLKEAAKKHRL